MRYAGYEQANDGCTKKRRNEISRYYSKYTLTQIITKMRIVLPTLHDQVSTEQKEAGYPDFAEAHLRVTQSPEEFSRPIPIGEFIRVRQQN